MIFDSMIFLARRRRILPPPPLVARAPQPPAPSPACDGPGYSFTGKHARAPQHLPACPLTDPNVEITETAVFGHLLAGWSPAPAASLLPLAREVAGPARRLVALTGWQVPPAAYPDPAQNPGPARYAKLMRRVSAATGTSSSYENPRAWAARALTPGGAA